MYCSTPGQAASTLCVSTASRPGRGVGVCVRGGGCLHRWAQHAPLRSYTTSNLWPCSALFTASGFCGATACQEMQQLHPGETRRTRRSPATCLMAALNLANDSGVSSGICVAMGVLPRVNSVTCWAHGAPRQATAACQRRERQTASQHAHTPRGPASPARGPGRRR